MTRDLLDFDPKCQSLQYLHLLKTIYVLCDFYFKLLVNPGFSCGDRFWKIICSKIYKNDVPEFYYNHNPTNEIKITSRSHVVRKINYIRKTVMK